MKLFNLNLESTYTRDRKGGIKLNKNRDEMKKIGEEIDMSIYHIRQAKGMGNEIADIMSKVDMLNGLVEEGLMDAELYKSYALRQKVDVKSMIAQIYANMELDKVECVFDKIFEKEV